MVELEPGPPVGGSQQRLQSAGQVDEHVAHQEEPAGHRGRDTPHSDGDAFASLHSPPLPSPTPLLLLQGGNGTATGAGSHMERMGATASREAMRMPLSQMQAVSRRDQVGSPLAFPWPKICTDDADKHWKW